MPTIKLTIAYDGTRYCGWQSQKGHQVTSSPVHKLRTIQEEIESVLCKIFKKKIRVEGSGRTDAGVHALAQSAHFKMRARFDPGKLQKALNASLPSDIFICKVEKADKHFHARFQAKRKTYRYLVINSEDRPLFIRHLGAWVRFPLDIQKMKSAAKYLLGRRDFKSFQARDRIKRNSVTVIYNIQIRNAAAAADIPFIAQKELLTIDIEAQGFLRNMVRNIVGTLLEVGRGRIRPAQVKDILNKKDRKFAGPCAPAQGLYLMDVAYNA